MLSYVSGYAHIQLENSKYFPYFTLYRTNVNEHTFDHASALNVSTYFPYILVVYERILREFLAFQMT